MAGVRDWARLVRLPNLFTAAADPLAGALIVGAAANGPGPWLALPFASMAIYAGGVALNDWFDYEEDRAERPSRPLPSGRISRKSALVGAIVLMATGLLLAGASGSLASLATAGALVLAVVGYDAGLRKSALGPLAMGTCRALNFLMGVAVVPMDEGPSIAGRLALPYLAFVAGTTLISRSETKSGGRANVAWGWALQVVALVAAAWWTLQADSAWIGPGGAVLGLVAVVTGLSNARALNRPVPLAIQGAVKAGVLAMPVYQAALVMAWAGPWPALAVAALLAPALVIGRWLYVT